VAFAAGGRLAQALGFMPVSREEIGSLFFAPRPRPAVDPFSKKAVLWFVAILLVLLSAFELLPILRVPVGPTHEVTGVVGSLGFDAQDRLTASVRLNSGVVVLVRVPHSARLSLGAPIAVTVQPLRFGPPRYTLARSPTQ
jgi:hypothetical protein